MLRRTDLLFTITGRHIEITDAIRTHAEEKTAKLPHYYDCITQTEVIIDGSDGGNTGVEIIVHCERHNPFVVHERGDDAYGLIDLAIHKLERRLRDTKEKERNKKHSAG